MKAEGILTALALTNLIFFLYTFLDFPRRIALRFSATHLKEAFAYSLPLIPHSLAGWAMGLIDRLFLNHYRDAASVGVYSIGAQFGNLINIATVAVNQAYVPWFFEQFEKGQEGRARIVRASEAMVLAYCACALAVSLFAQEALLLMVSEEFRTGWTVVPPLAFSFVFSGVYFLFVNPLFVRRTAFVPIVTVASGALGVALNMVLVPRFGMAGAAASSLGSMAASSILALILTSMLEPIGFRWVRMYGYVAIAFLLSQAVHLQGLLHPAIFILGKAVLAGATAAAVVLTHRTEAAKVWSIAQARLRRKKGA
jgi:O-antigen/teichoic acid export membrane protein